MSTHSEFSVARTTRVLLTLVALCAFAVGLSACATKISLTRGAMVPAARGEASGTTDDNGNVNVHLTVTSLAKPSALQPPQNLYLVWAKLKDGRELPMGELRVDESGSGELDAKVHDSSFQIVVSAEGSRSATKPSSQVVFSSNYVTVK